MLCSDHSLSSHLNIDIGCTLAMDPLCSAREQAGGAFANPTTKLANPNHSWAAARDSPADAYQATHDLQA